MLHSLCESDGMTSATGHGNSFLWQINLKYAKFSDFLIRTVLVITFLLLHTKPQNINSAAFWSSLYILRRRRYSDRL